MRMVNKHSFPIQSMGVLLAVCFISQRSSFSQGQQEWKALCQLDAVSLPQASPVTIQVFERKCN
jgi:hypothetical protein